LSISNCTGKISKNHTLSRGLGSERWGDGGDVVRLLYETLRERSPTGRCSFSFSLGDASANPQGGRQGRQAE
jgi:hypothetical protein